MPILGGLKLSKNKKMLMATLLIIALVQMPNLALTPSIQHMVETMFTDRSLKDVQNALAFMSFVGPISSLAAMFLLNRGILTKRHTVLIGLALLSLTGVLAIFFHTQYWHLWMLSICLGIAQGFFVSNAFGLLFDHFNDAEREKFTGLQSSFINGGGIMMSLLGGAMATLVWYGGYLVLLLGLPVAILGFFTIPRTKRVNLHKLRGGKEKKTPLNPKVYYYSAVTLMFMMIYGVGGNNLSTHMAALGTTATVGIATAVQMCGGVVAGLFFRRLSERLGDLLIPMGYLFVFIGFMVLSFFQHSLPVILASVFVAGMSMSLMLPRCNLSVSTLCDSTNSATATAIATSVAPSLGGFLTPRVFTTVTTALYGDSTVLRFRFVAVIALVFAVALTVVTVVLDRKKTAAAAV